jgi:hypothetical protein
MREPALAVLIVPNSEFMNHVVENMSREDLRLRVCVRVGAAYAPKQGEERGRGGIEGRQERRRDRRRENPRGGRYVERNFGSLGRRVYALVGKKAQRIEQDVSLQKGVKAVDALKKRIKALEKKKKALGT